MTFEEARQVLAEWTLHLEKKAPSTNTSARPHPNPDAASWRWWFENSGTTPDWRNPRTVAYLGAYVEIAGPAMPSTGIPVDDGGYIHPDRAVVRSLLQAECLNLADGTLRLADKGEALLAPLLKIEDGRPRRGVWP